MSSAAIEIKREELHFRRIGMRGSAAAMACARLKTRSPTAKRTTLFDCTAAKASARLWANCIPRATTAQQGLRFLNNTRPVRIDRCHAFSIQGELVHRPKQREGSDK